MSFAGILQFKKNLDKFTDSEQFKNMSERDRLKVGLGMLRVNPYKLKPTFDNLK